MFPGRQQILRLAHSLWAMLGTAGCLMLVVAGGGGHPPAIAFLPAILVNRLLGHNALWEQIGNRSGTRQQIEQIANRSGSQKGDGKV